MSLVATLATLVIGLPAAYLIARHRPGGRLLNVVIMIPWALPGTVIAMNLILAFNSDWAPLYNTVWLLPLAYVVRNVPLLTRMAGAAIAPFDATLLEGARTLGASRTYAFRRVAVPLLAPAVVAAMAMVFATSLGEFVASVLLYTPANVPISVQINMVLRGSVGAAFAYSVLLMVLVAATFLFARRFMTRTLT
jgi:iron(III) transport system permease protein